MEDDDTAAELAEISKQLEDPSCNMVGQNEKSGDPTVMRVRLPVIRSHHFMLGLVEI